MVYQVILISGKTNFVLKTWYFLLLKRKEWKLIIRMPQKWTNFDHNLKTGLFFLQAHSSCSKSHRNLRGIFYQMDHIWWAPSRLKKSKRLKYGVTVEPYIISFFNRHPVLWRRLKIGLRSTLSQQKSPVMRSVCSGENIKRMRRTLTPLSEDE